MVAEVCIDQLCKNGSIMKWMLDCGGSDVNPLELTFDVIGSCADLSSSSSKQVTVQVAANEVTLLTLNRLLRDKYPALSNYVLSHRDGTNIPSNKVTESERFWQCLSANSEICFAPHSAEESGIVEQTADLVLRMRSNDCNAADSLYVGVNMEQCTAGDMLAVAILMESLRNAGKNMDLGNTKSVERRVPTYVIGHPDSCCYIDEFYAFNSSNVITMAMLDVLACDTRLTSAGLAYAFRGFNSIFKTLRRRYEDSLLEADVLHSVYKRVYSRLIQSVDRWIAGEAGSNEPVTKRSKLTREADMFLTIFRQLPRVESRERDGEKTAKFLNALYVVRHFYVTLIDRVMAQLYGDLPPLATKTMGKGASNDATNNAEYPSAVEVVDRNISTFSQLNLNFENERLTRLSLSHNKISAIPPNISDLINLESLNLWNNQLEELPTTISALPNLKILNVGMNRLNKLPRGFGSFARLEILDLTYNNLREQSLPGNFFFMPTLRALYLGDNDFECFPEDVAHLVNLQILVLRENDLIDLPRQLATLGKLKELHIQGNRLQVIPPELGVLDLIDPKDANAKTLRVENNPWIGPLVDALQRDGIEAFWAYVRSDNYRRLYEGHPPGVGTPPPKRNKDKKISRVGHGSKATTPTAK